MTDEIEALEELSKKTDQFIGEVFDWVATLDERSLLPKLYDFQIAIKHHVEKLKEGE